MAIFPEPREDLFAEATAMPTRGEFQIEGETTCYFVGIRANGALSLYCDDAPVLHFNREGALRRAFVAGDQFGAQGGRLIRRRRSPPGGQVTLEDEPLDPAANTTLQQALQARLRRLAVAFQRAQVRWQRVTAAGELQDRLEPLLEKHAEKLFVADAPRQ
jgi:hypothetical protein